jgi:hypothetical protein
MNFFGWIVEFAKPKGYETGKGWGAEFVRGAKEEIDKAKGEQKEEPKDNSYMVMVTAAALNIRSGPSTNYKVVGIAKKNEKYKILEEKNGWGRHDKGWFGLSYTKKV